MKVLLDENFPHGLRHLLDAHEVVTVTYLGWSGTRNGVLLQRAANAGYDVMLTMDGGVQYQQNTQTLPIAVMILSAPSNDLDDLRALVPSVLAALDALVPRSVVRVE